MDPVLAALPVAFGHGHYPGSGISLTIKLFFLWAYYSRRQSICYIVSQPSQRQAGRYLPDRGATTNRSRTYRTLLH